ncbi:hypothetical protein BpHYR1_012153, partial [Brachionus plicatilis]
KFFFGPFCGRPVCTRSAVLRPFSWPATTRSVRQLAGHFAVGFILADSWPATSRFSKIWPVTSRSVSELAGHHTVGPSVGRPLHGRFLFWPIVGRPPHVEVRKQFSRIFCSTSFSEKLARTFLTVKLNFITPLIFVMNAFILFLIFVLKKKSFCAQRYIRLVTVKSR